MKTKEILIAAILICAGCSHGPGPDPGPNLPPPGAAHYGTGSLSFDAEGAGGQMAAAGSYKPSDQFASDSASEGAGGFVRDTTLFQRSVQAMFAGYVHHLAGGTLVERWLVVSLHGASGVLSAGEYPFAPSNTTETSQSAYVYFFYSDTAAFHEVFVPRDGTLSLTSFDPSTKHARGTFSGTLWGPLPDTTIRIPITAGAFDLSCSATYFNP